MRRRRGSEVAVGLLTLVTAAVVLWGYFWLTGRPLGWRGYKVFVRLPEAGGLARGALVRLAGVNVGTVRALRLHGTGAIAELLIDADVRPPRDTRVALRTDEVFGKRHLDLLPGEGREPLGEGDTLLADTGPTLVAALESAVAQAGEVLAQARSALSPQTVGAVQVSAVSLSRALEALAAFSAALARTANGGAAAFGAERVERMAAGLEASVQELAATSAELHRSAAALASVLAKIDRGRGLIGRAVNDASLYDSLLVAAATIRTAAEQAGLLLDDMRARPGRYLNVHVF
jgi:ABC-type transporter Mla subunit MlaD